MTGESVNCLFAGIELTSFDPEPHQRQSKRDHEAPLEGSAATKRIKDSDGVPKPPSIESENNPRRSSRRAKPTTMQQDFVSWLDVNDPELSIVTTETAQTLAVSRDVCIESFPSTLAGPFDGHSDGQSSCDDCSDDPDFTASPEFNATDSSDGKDASDMAT